MILLGLKDKMYEFTDGYDVKKVGVAIAGALIILVVVIWGLISIFSGSGESTEVVETVPGPYAAYQETGVDTAEVKPDTLNQLKQGYYIVGEYNPELAPIMLFKGYYSDNETRLRETQIDSDVAVIYVDGEGVQHEVEGTTLSDLEAAAK